MPPGLRQILDRLSLLAIAAGILLMFQPLWPQGFRAGFFLLLPATLLQIVVSHLPRRRNP